MSISEFIRSAGSREKTVTVYNDDKPEPIMRMLRRMFDAEDVTLREEEPPEKGPANVVVLEGEAEGDESFAISPVRDISESVLLVNSDLYITGTREIDEVETPDVLAGLDGTTFTVEGKQKMLLIEISRHIEAIAWREQRGQLHSGFQYLSRIEDERGTKRVYERLADTGVDVHIYGVPDEMPEVPDGVTVHADDGDEVRSSWFVALDGVPDSEKAALLAEKAGPSEWRGFWTFDPDLTDDVCEYLRERYHG